jgi:Leucine-rich repeat (LRR) protein
VELNNITTQFELLFQSKEIQEIEDALLIAQKNNIEVDEKAIDELYVYLRGPRPEDLPIDLAKKIKVINSCSRVHFYLKGASFEIKQFKYMKHLREVKVSFNCYAFQYIQVFLKTLFNHTEIEVLELLNYPLAFLPEGIEKIENLRVFKCINSKIETIQPPKRNLSKLEELDFTNSKNIDLVDFLKKLPNLKKLKISKTNLALKATELRKQYPTIEIII